MKLFYLLIAFVFLINTTPVFATAFEKGLTATAKTAGYGGAPEDVSLTVGNIIGIVLSFLGVIFL